jgi:hypothetical protein
LVHQNFAIGIQAAVLAQKARGFSIHRKQHRVAAFAEAISIPYGVPAPSGKGLKQIHFGFPSPEKTGCSLAR